MQKQEINRIADIVLEPNKKLGYYLVNNKIFYNKFQAMIEARPTNSPIRWFFNEETFVPFDWSHEPEADITELYRRRAQQLRDKYDWIMIESSGGADSTTAIFSFLLNGIHLDEIVYRYSELGGKVWETNVIDQTASNQLSEWEYAERPLLQWVADNFPQTKITMLDYSENIRNDHEFDKDESWVFTTKHFISPCYTMGKFDNYHDSFKQQADQGQKICIIYGADKPKIFIKDNRYFLYFMDHFTGHSTPEVGAYTNVTNEPFYWTPDMPELIAKQAHMVRAWFEQPANRKFVEAIRWPHHVNMKTRTLYEQIVRNIIYPHYDMNTFQTAKPFTNIVNEHDDWFFKNFSDSRVHSVWKAGIDLLLDNIDSQYIIRKPGTDLATDVHVFHSPYYYFGECKIAEHQPVFRSKDLVQASIVPEHHTHRHVINGRLVIY